MNWIWKMMEEDWRMTLRHLALATELMVVIFAAVEKPEERKAYKGNQRLDWAIFRSRQL